MPCERIDLCKYYISVGYCKKKIDKANHWQYCQICDKYKTKKKKHGETEDREK